MRLRAIAVLLGLLGGLSCTEESDDTGGDGDGASSGATGGAPASGGTTTLGGNSGSGGTASGGAAGSGATPSGGTTSGGGGTGAVGATGGTATAGAAGAAAGNGGAPWSCDILEANGNCYCGRTAEPQPLTACPPNWPCCVKFNGELDGVVYEYCACEGIESSAECDRVAGALLGGMRVTNCPPP